jgi:hypothetical protein
MSLQPMIHAMETYLPELIENSKPTRESSPVTGHTYKIRIAASLGKRLGRISGKGKRPRRCDQNLKISPHDTFSLVTDPCCPDTICP